MSAATNNLTLAGWLPKGTWQCPLFEATCLGLVGETKGNTPPIFRGSQKETQLRGPARWDFLVGVTQADPTAPKPQGGPRACSARPRSAQPADSPALWRGRPALSLRGRKRRRRAGQTKRAPAEAQSKPGPKMAVPEPFKNFPGDPQLARGPSLLSSWVLMVAQLTFPPSDTFRLCFT